MRLFTQIVAPNPTKVELYLAEKAALGCEIPLERETVNLMEGEHRTQEFVEKNPFQRLPCLELEDGTILLESLPIIEYFEERWPEPAMIGETPEERARVRALERSMDLDLLVGIAWRVHTTNSPVGYDKIPEVAAWAEERMATPLQVLNETLSDGRAFVAGDKPTIADCTLGAALQFARFGKFDVLDGHDNIQRWDESYRARPLVQSVLVL